MKNNNLIGISGKIGSGKDLTAEIIQYLTSTEYKRIGDKYSYASFIVDRKIGNEDCMSSYQIRRFADKLKDIVCLLIGCTREQLEDREFKEKELGEEWKCFEIYNSETHNTVKIVLTENEVIDFIEDNYAFHFCQIRERILTPRLLLQLLGTECGRNIIHPNIWCNSLFSDYIPNNIRCNNCCWYGEEQDLIRGEDEEGLFDGCPTCDTDNYLMDIKQSKWIISDVRFPNEAKAIKDRGGILIRIERDYVLRGGPEDPKNQHPSETALDYFEDWDYIIQNDSTVENLIQKVKKILIKEGII